MRQVAALFLSACALTPAALAQTVYVDVSAPAGGNGASWATAYNNLGTAMIAATSGTALWVAAGLYSGGFNLPDGVTVLGGFEAGATKVSQRDWFLHQVFLDGGANARVINLGANCTLDGVFVQSGYASGAAGASVYRTGTTVRNCVFQGNAIYSGAGTAIGVSGGSSPLIEYCIFSYNDFGGNVIEVSGSGGTFDHLVFWGNRGCAISMTRAATCAIRNCVFGNSAVSGIWDHSATNQPVLENNLFWNNTVSHVDFRGQQLTTAAAINALSYASNNLVADPAFANPQQYDYRTALGSPVIEAGRNTGVVARAYYGNPRTLDGDLDGVMTTDIGVAEFGYVRLAITGNATPGGTVSFNTTGMLPTYLLVGFGTGPGLEISPFGTLFLALNRPIADFSIGVPPSQTPVLIPSTFPVGVSVPFQLLAFAGFQGTLSNTVDLLVR